MSAAGVILDLDDVRDYARCSLAWFWSGLPIVPVQTHCQDLFEDSLRAGVRQWVTGAVEDLSDGVVGAWRAWCAEWSDAALPGDLLTYATTRAAILEPFENGTLKNFDGGRYTQPRLTTRYKQLYRDRGLLALGRRLDDFARSQGLQGGPVGEGVETGSPLGDAFADAVTAVERMRAADPGLPERAGVAGVDIPFRVALTPALSVEGRADLVVATADSGAVQLEIHEFAPAQTLRAGEAARDARVIAALLAGPWDEAPELPWTSVASVVLRHWRLGQAWVVREPNPGYLLNVVGSIARGMRCGVVVPRALNGQGACRGCGYWEQCWSPAGWRSAPLVEPGLLAAAAEPEPMRKKVSGSCP